jgi:RecB family exonuclease
VLGVSVVTLWTVARDILERAGEPAEAADPLFEILARREALAEKSLARVLGDLRQGPGLAAASVRDLLSAGFLPDEGGDPRGMLLAHPHPGERERALSVLAAAGRTVAAMERHGVRRAGELQHRAAVLLRERGASLLPYRAVLVHGFADATGQSADLLSAMLETVGGRLYLDEPADPARPDRPDRGLPFVRGFAGRLLESSEKEPAWEPPTEPAQLGVMSASGSDAEIREVAARIRELLDAGVESESIGVVSRSLPGCAAALRRHFGALGIPFSGGEAPEGYHPEARRWTAALELLELGPATAADRWLDALRPGLTRRPLEDLRLGVRALGAARLGEVARLDPDSILDDKVGFPLPVRRGFAGRAATEETGDKEGGDESRTIRGAVRRRLHGDFLRWGVDHARGLLERWQEHPQRGSLNRMAAFVGDLLHVELGWQVHPRSQPEEGGLDARARDLLRHLPGMSSADLSLDWDEVPLILQGSLDLAESLGGRGAGVRVMDVAHARGCTFEHLFLLGLNRDLFPRNPLGDPLLPDDARRLLLSRLPHLHVKEEARLEERYLFAELVSAAPRVTLSWQRADDEGRERSPSPFLVRLEIEAGLAEEGPAPRDMEKVLRPPWSGGDRRPRTARDSARLAALSLPRPRLGGFFALALEEARARAGIETKPVARPGDLARARLSVLDEWEPDRRTRDGNLRALRPGPFQGFVGPPASEMDPRGGPVYVTRLESVARCPWQAFLRSFLRIEPVPDPFGTLPALDNLILGNTVHRTLDRLFRRASGRDTDSLAVALEEGPVAVRRPGARQVREVLAEMAAAVARDEGIHLPGIHEALVRMARPHLENALDLLHKEAGPTVRLLGCELEGVSLLPGPGGEVELRFRADQATLHDEVVVLTDFKTGKAVSKAKTPAKRAEHLLNGIREGLRLQVVAYAGCQVPEGTRVEGRYLFVRPDLEADTVVVTVGPDGPEGSAEAFQDAAGAVLQALRDGTFFPRLENAKGGSPGTCNFCEVTDACGLQDSGFRRRLVHLVTRARDRVAEKKPVGVAERELTRLWFLGHEEKA